MKKIIGLIAAASMLAAVSGAAMAADNAPTVYVNDTRIVFDDQEPVILGEGYTVVPARGVFEAMGANVEWDGEKRQVEVTSKDSKTLIRLVIDDNTMKVYDMSEFMGTLMAGLPFQAPETDVTLDVAPQIINDRTMIPLRAISEALNANVEWNGEVYDIDITTADAPADKSALPTYYLTSDVNEAAEGETFDIYVNVRNLPAATYVSSVSVTVNYDKDNFECVDAAFVKGDTVIEGAIGGSNPEYYEGAVKAVFVAASEENAPNEDGAIMKLTFKSLNGKQGAFWISDSYNTRLGYDTSLNTDAIGEEVISISYEGDDINLHTPSVTIEAVEDNGEAAPAEENVSGAAAPVIEIDDANAPAAPEDAVVLDPTPVDEHEVPAQ